ncbi:MAG: hypothetical protein R6U43_04220 [Candidatus Krumholzibacteriales bacterium]
MNINSSINRPFLILAILLISSGCYTVLNHPAVETSSYDYEYSSCYDCHTGAFFHHSYGRAPYPGIWGAYYYEPWWHSEILIMEENGGAFTRSVIPGRDFRTRGSGEAGARSDIRSRELPDVSPVAPSSLKKSDHKVRKVRKARDTRSRSEARDSSSSDKRRSSSGKKKRSSRDRD